MTLRDVVVEKVQALRTALENAARDQPEAQSLLQAMDEELRGLERGAIALPYALSHWGIYVMPDHRIYESHPEVTKAFGALELVIEHSDLESYEKRRAMLEEMARPFQR
jgi:hypothetical protein